MQCASSAAFIRLESWPKGLRVVNKDDVNEKANGTEWNGIAGKGKSFVNGAKELAGKQDIMFGQPLKSTYANASAPNDISLNVYVQFILKHQMHPIKLLPLT